MNIVAKILIIVGLVVIIFGGGAFAAYELLFKKPVSAGKAGAQAVVTPTPDPVPGLFAEAKNQIAGGDINQAKTTLISLIQAFPKSPTIDDVRRALGDLNIQQFFSPEPGPGKSEYVVVRGDSIVRIAHKTKAPEELLMRANGLETIRLQPGQRFIVPTGQFSLLLNTKDKDLTLLNHGVFFRWYKPVSFQMPPKLSGGRLDNSASLATESKKYRLSSNDISLAAFLVDSAVDRPYGDIRRHPNASSCRQPSLAECTAARSASR